MTTKREERPAPPTVYAERPCDADTVADIRKRLTAWAAKIPNHGIEDFGAQVGIREAISRPIYIVRVDTQYERRSLQRGSRAYEGGAISAKTKAEDDIDVWQPQLAATTDFTNVKKEYEVEHTDEIEQCDTCNGRGNVVCPRCDGARFLECHSCDGRGELACRSCDGHGDKSCYSCSGTGSKDCSSCGGKGSHEETDYIGGRSVTKRRSCSSCSGKGNSRCSSCRNGRVDCDTCRRRGLVTCSGCNGKGENPCSTCYAKGQLTCSPCEGYGRLVHYLYIEDSFSTTADRQEFIPAETIPEITAMLPARLTDAVAPIARADALRLEADHFPNVVHDGVKRVIAQLRSQTLSREEPVSPHGGVRILRQVLTLRRVEVIAVKYEYLKRLFDCWFIGTAREIFVQKSPIDDIADRYFLEAFHQHRRGDFSSALEFLAKAEAMAPASPVTADLKANVTRSILNQYHRGALAGGLIAFIISAGVAATSARLRSDPPIVIGAEIALLAFVALLSSMAIGSLFASLSGTMILSARGRHVLPAIWEIVVLGSLQILLLLFGVSPMDMASPLIASLWK